MIVLLMVVSFVIGYVDRMCQCVFLCCFFFHHSVWLCRYEFFYLSLPVGDKFF